MTYLVLQDLAGAAVAHNPCIDDAKDVESLCAESPPRSDHDSAPKDQSLADLYWVLYKCPIHTCFLFMV